MRQKILKNFWFLRATKQEKKEKKSDILNNETNYVFYIWGNL